MPTEKILGPAATTPKQRSARAFTAGTRAASFVRSEVNRILTKHEGHVIEQDRTVAHEALRARCVTCGGQELLVEVVIHD
jgi:hypothetical protein